MHCCLNYMMATLSMKTQIVKERCWSLNGSHGALDGDERWSEAMVWRKTPCSSTMCAQSLNIWGLSKHQAVVDFIYKHIHLMYFYSHFSTCWMICIVFSRGSWFKTIAFWTVFLRILVCESMNYISKIICNFCSEYILPSIMTGSYISNEGSTCVYSKTV